MACTAKQLKHNNLLNPCDHFQLLTAGIEDNPHGAVLVGWQPLRKPKWFKAGLDRARDQLAGYTNEPDIFLTPNLFHGWRLIRLLNGLTAFYIDIDDHTSAKPDLMLMRTKAQAVIDECNGIPEPNFVVYSGRGIHLYWLLDNVPAQALPRWRAVQKILCEAFNGDPKATDPTRVLRVVGSINSKTGERVTGELIHTGCYDFNLFCDEVLPYSQVEVRDFRAAKARRDALKKADAKAHRKMVRQYNAKAKQWAEEKEAKASRKTGKNIGSIYQRWYKVYEDLLAIQNHFWFGGIREQGYRNHMLYHTANALSWFTHGDALEREILATARIMVPDFTDAATKSHCGSVIKRAKASAKGGEELRYKYKRETLWEEFKPLIGGEPELVQSLRAIIPNELHEERRANRDRVAEGRYKKSKDDFAKQKREVRKMLSQGFSQKYIGEQLGLSKSRISRIVKELKK